MANLRIHQLNQSNNNLQTNDRFAIDQFNPINGLFETKYLTGQQILNSLITQQPAGNTGEIQFNVGGKFFASSDLFWDNQNSRLGIHTTTPQFSIDIESSSLSFPSLRLNQTGISGGQIIYSDNAVIKHRIRHDSMLNYLTFSKDNGDYLKISDSVPNDTILINTSGYIGINNTSPNAQIDIKAQGALSTDGSFRIRNSGDSFDIVSVRGDGSFYLKKGPSSHQISIDSTGNVNLLRPGINIILTSTSIDMIGWVNGKTGFRSPRVDVMTTPTTGHNGTNVLSVQIGTTPTASLTDRFQLYSADITSGNAVPHFRTENSDIIKLYKSPNESSVKDISKILG